MPHLDGAKLRGSYRGECCRSIRLMEGRLIQFVDDRYLGLGAFGSGSPTTGARC